MTTFTYDANGALVKKEDPLVGTTYYVGPHYEVLAPAVILPPAPTDLEACRESGSPPNVCNDLSWTGSEGVTYSIYRNSTSPVPIDAGHLVTSGITETNYTDCGTVYGRSPEANDSLHAFSCRPCTREPSPIPARAPYHIWWAKQGSNL
jgi:hypothetical protein